jgi:hypothetical protein
LIGLDIAKSVFQIHGVDVDGAVVKRAMADETHCANLSGFSETAGIAVEEHACREWTYSHVSCGAGRS